MKRLIPLLLAAVLLVSLLPFSASAVETAPGAAAFEDADPTTDLKNR